MSDTEPKTPRRKTSKAPAFADDWPDVGAEAAAAVAATPAAPERQRIARAMARAGLCSRRDAEAWILAGRVAVNGDVLTSPALDVGPDDMVEVDGQPLPEADKTRLFLFHKPRGLVTSDHDPEGRETVADYLREKWPKGPRVVTVGRLDINTEGLLLLTNDGGLARVLELPKTGWLRRYRVRANGETDQAKLDALAAGISIDGVDYAGIEAKLDRVQGANCWLTMGLREGKNREIKRVLEHLGLGVNRLIRLSFGPFQLLDLEEGAVEEVRTRVLKDQLGEALAAEAGVDFGDAPPAAVAEPAKRPTKAEKVREPKPGKTDATQRRREAPRAAHGDGERGLRRRTPAFTPKSETRDDREPGRPRRHVSSLRSARTEETASGPRKRIERSATRDRNDRTVAVERKVAARPARAMSPSAEGKRARIARSGAGRRQTEGAERPREGSGARSRDAGGDETRHEGRRPARSAAGARAPRREASADRPPRGQTAERPRGDRPARSTSGRQNRPPRVSGSEPPRTRTTGRGEGSRDARSNDGARASKPYGKARDGRPASRSAPSGNAPERGASGRGDGPRTPRGAGDGFKRPSRAGGSGSGNRSPGGRAPGGRTPGKGSPGGTRPPRGGRPGGAPGRGKR